MKTNLLCVFLLLPFLAAAQFPIPMPLTDSFSDNRNPDVVLLDGYQALMVWEKSNSPDSTAIYGKILHPSGIIDTASFKIIGHSGMHYKHPVIMFLQEFAGPVQDTLACIFYETIENGNRDIYFFKYDVNGFLYGPFPFAVTTEDEKDLSISGSNFSLNNGLAWQSGDKIVTCRAIWNNTAGTYVFDAAVIIDSGNVNRPVISDGGDFILWEKEVNGVKKVAGSSYDYTLMTWSLPIVYNKPGSNTQISTVKGLWGIQPSSFVWKGGDAGQTHIFGREFSTFPDSLDIVSSYNLEDPCASIAPIIIKNSQWMNGIFLVFDTDSLGNNEVMSDWMMFGKQNISNSPYEDVHPKLFMLPGFGNWIYEIAITWESFRNGHWQIWYTYMDMSGGIDPLPAEKFEVSFSPNPFRDQLKVDFSLKEDQDVTLSMYNSVGIKMVEIPAIKGYMGGNTYFINAIDGNGKRFPKGMYMIQVDCKDGTKTSKIIKM